MIAKLLILFVIANPYLVNAEYVCSPNQLNPPVWQAASTEWRNNVRSAAGRGPTDEADVPTFHKPNLEGSPPVHLPFIEYLNCALPTKTGRHDQLIDREKIREFVNETKKLKAVLVDKKHELCPESSKVMPLCPRSMMVTDVWIGFANSKGLNDSGSGLDNFLTRAALYGNDKAYRTLGKKFDQFAAACTNSDESFESLNYDFALDLWDPKWFADVSRDGSFDHTCTDLRNATACLLFDLEQLKVLKAACAIIPGTSEGLEILVTTMEAVTTRFVDELIRQQLSTRIYPLERFSKEFLQNVTRNLTVAAQRLKISDLVIVRPADCKATFPAATAENCIHAAVQSIYGPLQESFVDNAYQAYARYYWNSKEHGALRAAITEFEHSTMSIMEKDHLGPQDPLENFKQNVTNFFFVDFELHHAAKNWTNETYYFQKVSNQTRVKMFSECNGARNWTEIEDFFFSKTAKNISELCRNKPEVVLRVSLFTSFYLHANIYAVRWCAMLASNVREKDLVKDYLNNGTLQTVRDVEGLFQAAFNLALKHQIPTTKGPTITTSTTTPGTTTRPPLLYPLEMFDADFVGNVTEKLNTSAATLRNITELVIVRADDCTTVFPGAADANCTRAAAHSVYRHLRDSVVDSAYQAYARFNQSSPLHRALTVAISQFENSARSVINKDILGNDTTLAYLRHNVAKEFNNDSDVVHAAARWMNETYQFQKVSNQTRQEMFNACSNARNWNQIKGFFDIPYTQLSETCRNTPEVVLRLWLLASYYLHTNIYAVRWCAMITSNEFGRDLVNDSLIDPLNVTRGIEVLFEDAFDYAADQQIRTTKGPTTTTSTSTATVLITSSVISSASTGNPTESTSIVSSSITSTVATTTESTTTSSLKTTVMSTTSVSSSTTMLRTPQHSILSSVGTTPESPTSSSLKKTESTSIEGPTTKVPASSSAVPTSTVSTVGTTAEPSTSSSPKATMSTSAAGSATLLTTTSHSTLTSARTNLESTTSPSLKSTGSTCAESSSTTKSPGLSSVLSSMTTTPESSTSSTTKSAVSTSATGSTTKLSARPETSFTPSGPLITVTAPLPPLVETLNLTKVTEQELQPIVSEVHKITVDLLASIANITASGQANCSAFLPTFAGVNESNCIREIGQAIFGNGNESFAFTAASLLARSANTSAQEWQNLRQTLTQYANQITTILDQDAKAPSGQQLKDFLDTLSKQTAELGNITDDAVEDIQQQLQETKLRQRRSAVDDMSMGQTMSMKQRCEDLHDLIPMVRNISKTVDSEAKILNLTSGNQATIVRLWIFVSHQLHSTISAIKLCAIDEHLGRRDQSFTLETTDELLRDIKRIEAQFQQAYETAARGPATTGDPTARTFPPRTATMPTRKEPTAKTTSAKSTSGPTQQRTMPTHRTDGSTTLPNTTKPAKTPSVNGTMESATASNLTTGTSTKLINYTQPTGSQTTPPTPTKPVTKAPVNWTMESTTARNATAGTSPRLTNYTETTTQSTKTAPTGATTGTGTAATETPRTSSKPANYTQTTISLTSPATATATVTKIPVNRTMTSPTAIKSTTGTSTKLTNYTQSTSTITSPRASAMSTKTTSTRRPTGTATIRSGTSGPTSKPTFTNYTFELYDPSNLTKMTAQLDKALKLLKAVSSMSREVLFTNDDCRNLYANHTILQQSMNCISASALANFGPKNSSIVAQALMMLARSNLSDERIALEYAYGNYSNYADYKLLPGRDRSAELSTMIKPAFDATSGTRAAIGKAKNFAASNRKPDWETTMEKACISANTAGEASKVVQLLSDSETIVRASGGSSAVITRLYILINFRYLHQTLFVANWCGMRASNTARRDLVPVAVGPVQKAIATLEERFAEAFEIAVTQSNWTTMSTRTKTSARPNVTHSLTAPTRTHSRQPTTQRNASVTKAPGSTTKSPLIYPLEMFNDTYVRHVTAKINNASQMLDSFVNVTRVDAAECLLTFGAPTAEACIGSASRAIFGSLNESVIGQGIEAYARSNQSSKVHKNLNATLSALNESVTSLLDDHSLESLVLATDKDNNTGPIKKRLLDISDDFAVERRFRFTAAKWTHEAYNSHSVSQRTQEDMQSTCRQINSLAKIEKMAKESKNTLPIVCKHKPAIVLRLWLYASYFLHAKLHAVRWCAMLDSNDAGNDSLPGALAPTLQAIDSVKQLYQKAFNFAMEKQPNETTKKPPGTTVRVTSTVSSSNASSKTTVSLPTFPSAWSTRKSSAQTTAIGSVGSSQGTETTTSSARTFQSFTVTKSNATASPATKTSTATNTTRGLTQTTSSTPETRATLATATPGTTSDTTAAPISTTTRSFTTTSGKASTTSVTPDVPLPSDAKLSFKTPSKADIHNLNRRLNRSLDVLISLRGSPPAVFDCDEFLIRQGIPERKTHCIQNISGLILGPLYPWANETVIEDAEYAVATADDTTDTVRLAPLAKIIVRQLFPNEKGTTKDFRNVTNSLNDVTQSRLNKAWKYVKAWKARDADANEHRTGMCEPEAKLEQNLDAFFRLVKQGDRRKKIPSIERLDDVKVKELVMLSVQTGFYVRKVLAALRLCTIITMKSDGKRDYAKVEGVMFTYQRKAEDIEDVFVSKYNKLAIVERARRGESGAPGASITKALRIEIAKSNDTNVVESLANQSGTPAVIVQPTASSASAIEISSAVQETTTKLDGMTGPQDTSAVTGMKTSPTVKTTTSTVAKAKTASTESRSIGQISTRTGRSTTFSTTGTSAKTGIFSTRHSTAGSSVRESLTSAKRGKDEPSTNTPKTVHTKPESTIATHSASHQVGTASRHLESKSTGSPTLTVKGASTSGKLPLTSAPTKAGHESKTSSTEGGATGSTSTAKVASKTTALKKQPTSKPEGTEATSAAKTATSSGSLKKTVGKTSHVTSKTSSTVKKPDEIHSTGKTFGTLDSGRATSTPKTAKTTGPATTTNVGVTSGKTSKTASPAKAHGEGKTLSTGGGTDSTSMPKTASMIAASKKQTTAHPGDIEATSATIVATTSGKLTKTVGHAESKPTKTSSTASKPDETRLTDKTRATHTAGATTSTSNTAETTGPTLPAKVDATSGKTPKTVTPSKAGQEQSNTSSTAGGIGSSITRMEATLSTAPKKKTSTPTQAGGTEATSATKTATAFGKLAKTAGHTELNATSKTTPGVHGDTTHSAKQPRQTTSTRTGKSTGHRAGATALTTETAKSTGRTRMPAASTGTRLTDKTSKSPSSVGSAFPTTKGLKLKATSVETEPSAPQTPRTKQTHLVTSAAQHGITGSKMPPPAKKTSSTSQMHKTTDESKASSISLETAATSMSRTTVDRPIVAELTEKLETALTSLSLVMNDTWPTSINCEEFGPDVNGKTDSKTCIKRASVAILGIGDEGGHAQASLVEQAVKVLKQLEKKPGAKRTSEEKLLQATFKAFSEEMQAIPGKLSDPPPLSKLGPKQLAAVLEQSGRAQKLALDILGSDTDSAKLCKHANLGNEIVGVVESLEKGVGFASSGGDYVPRASDVRFEDPHATLKLAIFVGFRLRYLIAAAEVCQAVERVENAAAKIIKLREQTYKVLEGFQTAFSAEDKYFKDAIKEATTIRPTVLTQKLTADQKLEPMKEFEVDELAKEIMQATDMAVKLADDRIAFNCEEYMSDPNAFFDSKNCVANVAKTILGAGKKSLVERAKLAVAATHGKTEKTPSDKKLSKALIDYDAAINKLGESGEMDQKEIESTLKLANAGNGGVGKTDKALQRFANEKESGKAEILENLHIKCQKRGEGKIDPIAVLQKILGDLEGPGGRSGGAKLSLKQARELGAKSIVKAFVVVGYRARENLFAVDWCETAMDKVMASGGIIEAPRVVYDMAKGQEIVGEIEDLFKDAYNERVPDVKTGR